MLGFFKLVSVNVEKMTKFELSAIEIKILFLPLILFLMAPFDGYTYTKMDTIFEISVKNAFK